MKMGKIEKWLVNRPGREQQAINRAEKLLKFVEVNEGQKFLEIGCGTGAVSRYLAKKYNLIVTGIDVDPEQIKLAQRNTESTAKINFFEGDATKLECRDGEFDIVLSFGVTHHINNWIYALKETQRVLRPGGYFIYFDLVTPASIAKIARRFARSFGVVTLAEINSFTGENSFYTIHSALTKHLILNEYEAVYRKKPVRTRKT